MQKNTDGKTPLHTLISRNARDFEQEEEVSLTEKLSLLISRGIQLHAGGEFGIGGLFNATFNETVQANVFDNWVVVLPALQQAMTIPDNQRQPIVHAAIINKAPKCIIHSLVHCFPESIDTLDSIGRFPIDVAVQLRLHWDGGMKDIVEVFASTHQAIVINVCAKHGLEWDIGMRNALEENEVTGVDSRDKSSGLRLFMLSAVGGRYNYDLGSIFQLIKRCPRLVQEYI